MRTVTHSRLLWQALRLRLLTAQRDLAVLIEGMLDRTPGPRPAWTLPAPVADAIDAAFAGFDAGQRRLERGH